MRCDQCQVLRINGVACHEIGCPNAWRKEERECRWCGGMFRPESKRQSCCDDSCHAAFHGIDLEDDQ